MCQLYAVYEGQKIKNILICVLTMNKVVTGLEQHEGEKLMTEFSFLIEPSV